LIWCCDAPEALPGPDGRLLSSSQWGNTHSGSAHFEHQQLKQESIKSMPPLFAPPRASTEFDEMIFHLGERKSPLHNSLPLGERRARIPPCTGSGAGISSSFNAAASSRAERHRVHNKNSVDSEFRRPRHAHAERESGFFPGGEWKNSSD